MCEKCKRKGYYQVDYLKQVINVLDSELKVVETLTSDEFIKRIINLYDKKEKQPVEHEEIPEFEEERGDHI
jgi:hypothetical protein